MRTLVDIVIVFILDLFLLFIIVSNAHAGNYCNLSITPEQNPECWKSTPKVVKVKTKKNIDKACAFSYAPEQNRECFKEKTKPQKSSYQEKKGDLGYFCKFSYTEEECVR